MSVLHVVKKICRCRPDDNAEVGKDSVQVFCVIRESKLCMSICAVG